jgi:hypothetical protein
MSIFLDFLVLTGNTVANLFLNVNLQAIEHVAPMMDHFDVIPNDIVQKVHGKFPGEQFFV